MKKCSVCGYMNDDDASTCISCGSQLDSGTNVNPGGNTSAKPIKPARKSSHGPRPFYANWIFWAVVVVVIGAFVAFSVTKKKEATYLNLSATQVLMPRVVSEYDIEVDTDGDWDLTHESDWIKTSTQGNKLHIDCDENTTGDNRKGWITITSGEQHVSIVVIQAGFASYIKVDKQNLVVDKAGSEFTINVNTDGSNYEVQYPNYCSVTKGATSFTINIPDNPDYAREGSLVVTSDQASTTVSFAQHGKCPICNGTGKMNCTTCNGTGTIITGYDGMFNAITGQCSACGGTGSVTCTTCSGTGIQ